MNFIYEFNWYISDESSLRGVFIATEEEVNQMIGKHVNFGFHEEWDSDVQGVLEKRDFKKHKISESASLLLYESIGKHISGYHPVEYLVKT